MTAFVPSRRCVAPGPEPRRRAAPREHARRRAGRAASRAGASPGRLERGGFAALDAVLGVEELAGLLLSNRPAARERAPARVVLVADRFPTRGDPLSDFARRLSDARVEASAPPGVI